MIDAESQQILSNTIFKFGPTEHVDRTLDNLTVGFSRLSEFNDPYESDYRIAHYFHSIEDERAILDTVTDPFERIKTLARSYLESLRITCFSRSPINNLMWSHYARNHTGVCYAFEFDSNNLPFTTEELGWGNIIYSSLLPELKIYQDQTTEGMFQTMLSDVVLTKSQDWSYEQEIRVYKRQEENSIGFQPNRLRAIIVGRKLSDEDETVINEAVARFNESNDTNLRILYAHRVARSFNLGISSYANMRRDSEGQFSASIPVLNNILSPPLTTIVDDET